MTGKKQIIFLLIAFIVVVAGCGKHQVYEQFGGYAQGGTWGVKANMTGVQVTGKDGKAIRSRRAVHAEVQRHIEAILYEIDTTLSGYNKASQLSRFNAGEDVELSPMFEEVLEAAVRFWEETDGALDCAAGPLFDIWGFGFKTDSLPSDELVRQTLARCGMARFTGRAPFEPSNKPVLNFNAIAQGYSCDKVAEYLYSIGVKDMLVDIGEIYCDGLNPKGKPWRIGIDSPKDGNNAPGADMDGIWESSGFRGDGRTGQGVVTSGNYRKFYIKDGKKYSHTIDPRSGYPVQHNLLSATIIAPTAMEADAYATYCMVIGLEAAGQFIESRPDIEGYLIYGDFETWASPGFNLVHN